jgi:hypothetical protein
LLYHSATKADRAAKEKGQRLRALRAFNLSPKFGRLPEGKRQVPRRLFLAAAAVGTEARVQQAILIIGGAATANRNLASAGQTLVKTGAAQAVCAVNHAAMAAVTHLHRALTWQHRVTAMAPRLLIPAPLFIPLRRFIPMLWRAMAWLRLGSVGCRSLAVVFIRQSRANDCDGGDSSQGFGKIIALAVGAGWNGNGGHHSKGCHCSNQSGCKTAGGICFQENHGVILFKWSSTWMRQS